MTEKKKLVHEIHVSEIRAFKKCRFAHQLKYVGSLYPKTTAKPLEFGTAYHAAKEVYYNPETWDYPAETKMNLSILKFVEICEEQKDAIGNTITESAQEDYSERIELGVGMLEYYFTHVATMENAEIVPVAVEKTFSVPLVSPDTGEHLMCACARCHEKADEAGIAYTEQWTGLPVHFEGTIDLLFKDLGTDKLWILDWKTTVRLSNNYEWVELDEQVNGYLVAFWLLGYDIAGFHYYETLKTFPKPPVKNKAKRMGRWYSVDKTQDTTYELYLAEITKGDPEGLLEGAYDGILSFLTMSGKDFYHKETVRRTEAQLKLAYMDLFNTAREMVNPLKIIYPSPSKFNCTYCEFEQVCIGRVTGADYQYTIDSLFEKKAPYYERN